jgi:hypothetical protein
MERVSEENGRGKREDTSTDGKMRPEEENGELSKATAILERRWQKRGPGARHLLGRFVTAIVDS